MGAGVGSNETTFHIHMGTSSSTLCGVPRELVKESVRIVYWNLRHSVGCCPACAAAAEEMRQVRQ